MGFHPLPVCPIRPSGTRIHNALDASGRGPAKRGKLHCPVKRVWIDCAFDLTNIPIFCQNMPLEIP